MQIDHYKLGRFLDSAKGACVALAFFAAIWAVTLTWCNQISEKGRLYHKNVAAAANFIMTVETSWPYDRIAIAKELAEMQGAYLATGERSPEKFRQLDRLQSWLNSAASVADQQQFLAEVRSEHGRVIQKRPWFADANDVFFLVLLTAILLIVLIAITQKWLMSREPRLRLVTHC